MRATLGFFKLFPPPIFMLMPHAGLDVSDDAIRCVAYSGVGDNRKLASYASADLPVGLVDGGDVKDEKEFVARLADFGREHGLSYVKISVPEEKAYLFQTEVPATDQRDVERNIEFKLEENVPLSAQDAVFYFDLLPPATNGATLRASVSVIPGTYVEHYMALLGKAGLTTVAFEVVPKAIARVVVSPNTMDAKLVVHIMNQKTGIYIISGGTVNFASTSTWGGAEKGSSQSEIIAALSKEVTRVHSYWLSHGNGRPLDELILVGRNAAAFESACRNIDVGSPLAVRVADVWTNAFDINRHLPPITNAESLEYAVAAGLALDTTYDD